MPPPLVTAAQYRVPNRFNLQEAMQGQSTMATQHVAREATQEQMDQRRQMAERQRKLYDREETDAILKVASNLLQSVDLSDNNENREAELGQVAGMIDGFIENTVSDPERKQAYRNFLKSSSWKSAKGDSNALALTKAIQNYEDISEREKEESRSKRATIAAGADVKKQAIKEEKAGERLTAQQEFDREQNKLKEEAAMAREKVKAKSREEVAKLRGGKKFVTSIDPETGEMTMSYETGTGLNKATEKFLEKDLAQMEGEIEYLGQIKEAWDPALKTIWGKGYGATLNSMSALGFSDEVLDFLGAERFIDKAGYLGRVTEHLFNMYRKRITGAQASYREIEYLRRAMLNDKLSPRKFQAFYKSYVKTIKRSMSLNLKLLREGYNEEEISQRIDELVLKDYKRPEGAPNAKKWIESGEYLKEREEFNNQSIMDEVDKALAGAQGD